MSVDPKLVDVQHQWDGMRDDPSEQDLLYAGAKEFPDKYLIERSEWADRIRAHEENQSSADFYSDRFTHQGNSHECVCHAAGQLFLVAWNRQLGGIEHSVWPSPLALYTRITGGRKWGGSVVIDSLYEMIENGMIPEHDGPGGEDTQKGKFKHTVVQTAGHGARFPKPRDLPDGWEETAKHFRVLEAFTIPDRQAHASALLHGWAICNGRQGHSIPHMNLVKEGNRYLSKYKDSYDVFRYDSERLWGGGYCIRSVTMPDDPSKPAGEDMA